MNICLTESPNMDNLRKVVKSPYIYKDDVKGYYAYLKMLETRNNSMVVTYKQNIYNDKAYGRYYPKVDGLSLKTAPYQWGPIRTYLFADTQTDIDMVNCHPTILYNICKDHKIEGTDNLKEYINNREVFIRDLNISQNDINNYNIINHSDMTIDKLGKIYFTSILYGGSETKCKKSSTSSINEFVYSKEPLKRTGKARDLVNELKRLREDIPNLQTFKTLVDDVKIEKNKCINKHISKNKKDKNITSGSLLSIILQDEESKIVIPAIEHFKTLGLTPTSWIYDGFHIPCTDINKINDILNDYNKTNDIPIKFIAKSFKNSLNDPILTSNFKDIRTIEEINNDENVYHGKDSNLKSLLTYDKNTFKNFDEDESIIITDDTDAAKKFLKIYKDKFVKVNDKIYYTKCLDNNRWVEGHSALSKAVLLLDMKKINDKGNEVPYSSNMSGCTNICKSIIDLSDSNSQFVRDNNLLLKDYLFYKNAIFCFKSKKFYKYNDPEVKELTPFIIINYDIPTLTLEGQTFMPIMDMNHPVVKDLEEKIFCAFKNDEERIYFYKCMSRAITGHYEDKVFYIFLGVRNSGKGVIQELFNVAFGDYICTGDAPLAKNINTDEAMKNRTLLSAGHDIGRILFTNESATLEDDKPAILDGNALKKRYASGGDPVLSRVMHANESKVVQNAIGVFTFNKCPQCKPIDAMEIARFFVTSYKFTKPTDIEIASGFSSLLKTPDNNIKQYIKTHPLFPLALLSILSHYWTNDSPRNFTIPESFKIANEDESPIEKCEDPITMIMNLFERDNDSVIKCSEVADILNLSIKSITTTLKTLNIEKKQKKYTTEERLKDPTLPQSYSVYCGIKKKEVKENDDMDSIDEFLNPNTKYEQKINTSFNEVLENNIDEELYLRMMIGS